MLLAQILHQIRHQKPRPELAHETGISLHRLNAMCADSKPVEPTTEEWRRLIRGVYEVAPEAALSLAQHATTELFTVRDLSPDLPACCSSPTELFSGLLVFSERAAGLSEKIALALKDGKVDTFEREDIELLSGRVSSVLEA